MSEKIFDKKNEVVEFIKRNRAELNKRLLQYERERLEQCI